MKNASCPKILKPLVSAETSTSAPSFSPSCRHLCFEAFEVVVVQARLSAEKASHFIYI